MQVQDLVGIVPWTFVFQICNLLLQMYLVKRFLFKPILAVIEKRKALADAEIAEATKAKEEARAMKASYEQELLDAKHHANELLMTAQKNATLQSEEIINEASKQAAAIKEKAQKDIDQEKRKAVHEIKEEIGSIAVEIAEKVIEREISEADHTKLIDEFIASVGEGA